VNGAASGDGVFHTNRKPLSFMKKLRPKNPLCLAVIEEAQVPSMAIMAGFCHDCLPTTDSAFASLSNSKSHRPPLLDQGRINSRLLNCIKFIGANP
jgi:hypothetical protein